MSYVCRNCPNKESFTQNAFGSCRWWERQAIDEDGEVQDSYDTEYDDYDNSDNENLACAECSSDNIEDVESEEWEFWEGPNGTPFQSRDEKDIKETWRKYLTRRNK